MFKIDPTHRLANALSRCNIRPFEWTHSLYYENKSELPKASGIYAMCDRGVVLYIGQAKNLRNRVLHHINRPGGFPGDIVRYVFVDVENLNEMEMNLIWRFKPIYNTRGMRM